ncbi:MAG: protein-glutamate O-methyltransferase [Pseudomonadota bacterium]
MSRAREMASALPLPPDIPRLTDAEFGRIAARVHAETGIVLKDHKRQMVYSRMARRVRALNMTSFTAYLDHLDRSTDAEEKRAFVNAVTTNLTSFFREDHHFDDFAASVLPRLLNRPDGRIRIWSAGCSSGEEPYTAAMLVLHHCNDHPPSDLRILATDIDTAMLDRGQAGIYKAERIAKIPARFARYMTDSPQAETMQVSGPVRRLVTFKPLNLIEPWPVSGPFDVIFCRNVLIYFDSPTKMEIVDRFAHLLRDGGTLYLGHSESLLDDHPLLDSVGGTIYRRRS